jgi:formylglycine-generating enzyme required for sulfatase activity
MQPVTQLIRFGLRQVLGESAGAADRALALVEEHFTDHSRSLPRALGRANDRAWQALGVALAGDGFLDRLKVFFASGDDKGIREQVSRFLADKSLAFAGTPADFRKACLADLTRARKQGALATDRLDAQEVAGLATDFRPYADPQGLIDGARAAVAAVADALAEYPNLARLLRQPTPGGCPPLLAAAFAYFFRREVETDAELARGLTFAALQRLSAGQEAAFEQVGQALATLGGRCEEILEQLGRIEEVVVATHGAVLDLHVELQRLGGLHLSSAEEVRRLFQEVLERLARVGMQRGEVRPPHSFSIRSEEERRAVRQLLERFRQLAPAEQQQVPALLNGLGKLQVGAGDFAGARQTFGQVAGVVGDPSGQAEASHNAYRAALEQRQWDEALTALRAAAERDPQRFAPFPLKRYQARRILGAGGFGTAFLCHDRHFDEEVVVKALHTAELQRDLSEVFREARVLRRLHHPAIIGVRDCEYADPATPARPYIVMDYFPGISLGAHVRERGTLAPADLREVAQAIAAAMRAAHAQGVLHRDLKPDNVLVCKAGERWQVKVIDFGLALGRQTIETSLARAAGEATILGDSVAGTVKYAPPEQMEQRLDASGKRVPVGPYSDVFAFGKLCCYALFRTTEPKGRHWGSSPAHGELREILERCAEEELEHRHAGFEPVLKGLEALDSAHQAEEERQHQARLQQEEQQRQRERAEAERRQRELEERQRQEDEKRRREQEAAEQRRRQEHERQQREQARLQQEEQQRQRERAEAERRQREAEERRRQEEDKRRQEQEAAEQRRRQEQERQQQERVRLQQEGETKLAQLVRAALDRTRGQPTAEDTAAARELCRQHHIADERAQAIAREAQKQWEKDHPKEPQPGEVLTIALDKGVEMKFAWIPAGTFLMGTPPGEEGRCDDETQHQVTLTRGFYLGIYPVTQRQYKAVMGTNPASFTTAKGGGPDHPVERVRWGEAVAFCEKLSNLPEEKRAGRAYHLPTEAEWEYACRGGASFSEPFHFGKTLSADQANINNNLGRTTPMSSYPANGFGLFDMHGNVREWCSDWHDSYPGGGVKDPTGPMNGICRVMRGGSWSLEPRCARSAYRSGGGPGNRSNDIGFRVVLQPGVRTRKSFRSLLLTSALKRREK